MFYEADLHTDRLSANRQRETAWSYRLDEFAPAELVPGFALHQTDRDVSRAEARVPCAAGAGRCAAASRRRDFDLLGYRYSLLAAVATGYTPLPWPGHFLAQTPACAGHPLAQTPPCQNTRLPRHPLAQDTRLPRPISLPCCLAPHCHALLHCPVAPAAMREPSHHAPPAPRAPPPPALGSCLSPLPTRPPPLPRWARAAPTSC